MRTIKECSVGLLGQGRIYQHVRGHVEGMYRVIPCTAESSPQQLAACGIVVFCGDTWSPRALQKVNRLCRQAGAALLPVYTQFDEGIIGPGVIPGEKGCASCAELRKLGAASSEAEHELLYHCLYAEQEPVVRQPWLSSFSLQALAVLVGEEIAAYFQRPEQMHTRCALLSLSLGTLECSRHTFLPVPLCPDCGELSQDRAELAVLTLQSCPKPDIFTYRASQPTASAAQIISTYVDQRTGLVSSLTVEKSDCLPVASAQLYAEQDGDAEMTTGTGCTLRPGQSKVVSVLEVVERYAGLRPRSKRTAVRASYQQLAQEGQPVLDPATLGLHSPEQYEYYQQHHICRHLVPYHPDLSYNWVWGYSFRRQSPILVPEHCAYYGLPINEENPAFVFDVSNGCALGNSLEEAIFHGMLEVIERDAFLLTWYARLGLPRLDLRSVTDPTVRLLIKHLEYHSGYTIYTWNATLDHAIPCLWLLAVDEQNRENTPKAHVVAGAHPHPEQALLRALRELASSLGAAAQMYREGKEQALRMFADASLVEEMEHHPLVYYLPEAFERFDFLYHTPRQQTFQEAFPDFSQHPPESLDLRDDLAWLLNAYLQRARDIIVVDQTAPEHRPCGLHCVKVLMPGLLPMTFGEHNRRVIGFERLHQLPYTLGYRDRPLTLAEINPYPHPFF
jgi:ribosomal protein S12 methylthiotransferase accessory factor